MSMVEPSKKDRLLEILNLLGIEVDTDAVMNFLQDGFQDMDCPRATSCAQFIVSKVHAAVCALVCPDQPEILQSHKPFTSPSTSEASMQLSRLQENMT